MKRRPQRSLRTILVVWFILFSVVPLAFVTWYSVNKYEKALDNELSVRLSGNGREVSVIFSDFADSLDAKSKRYLRDTSLIHNVSISDGSATRSLIINWLRSDIATSMTVFNREGRMIASSFKDEKGEARAFLTSANQEIFLSDSNLQRLRSSKHHALIEYGKDKKMSLINYHQITNRSGRIVGFLEQMIDIDENFLSRLKQRMKLELILLRGNAQVVAGTHPDFYLYQPESLQDLIKNEKTNFFDYTIRSEPFGFITYPLSWGDQNFYLALGASKAEARSVLKNVNLAFYSVVGAVIGLLIITILIASKTILKPLDELVEAIGEVQTSDRPFEIPVKSDTEIGLLTESFNSMARNIIQARSDLKRKITELESANDELRDTQAKLVHSSKMVSLGQLVAGVAHELNNPIGFIYSNMSHLDDYANSLLKFSEEVQKNPDSIDKLKKELDIEYIRQDLPKLISSCKEGARRTKDIVLGLRNFSRLDEAKLKEVDIHEAIDQTLSLLSGEIKNRVQVLKDYSELPLVTCYASQINQVFMNILSNALQAIEGGGNVWVRTQLIKRNDGTSWVSISFQDSGKGMTPEVLEKIFDPFFSTKPVGQGTGLGLSISYGIIQAHGGEIEVKSHPGIGTEFIVRIPVKYIE